ncbi:LamG domain-containing protein [Sporomusa sphaeroides DSM 2875]|uniref:LamG domain-containing protein n=1 Tax=Sporomusa sphaeroides TaxID=47679 RepID=UPI00202DE618|nr:LamG domain-containing protein [Sporomusa sphaeroides]MCM0759930.1 LamG domain-containing protein [Sporomusa sphaeroides DSM 2875]
MPMLPKRPAALLHFDQLPVDYRTDIFAPIEPSGTIGTQVLFKNIDSLRGNTLFLSNKKYVQIQDSSYFDVSKSFTLKYWIHTISISNTLSYIEIGNTPNSSSNPIRVQCSSSPRHYFWTSDSLTATVLQNLDYNKWQHCEIGYDEITKTLYFFKNGKLDTTRTLSKNLTWTSEMPLFLGRNLANSNFEALVADFDFIPGICEHTDNFTPEPINSKEITKALHPMITDVQSKFGEKSLMLNGSNYLLADLTIDTFSDFTVSYWEYLTATRQGAASLCFNYDGGTLAGHAAFILGYTNASGSSAIFASSNGSSWDVINGIVIEPSATSLFNKWNHWEVGYESSSKMLHIFLDGVLKYSVVCPTPLRGVGQLYLGAWGSNRQTAFYDELLVLQGACLHTDSFTPPDEPYTLPEQELVGYVLQAPSSGTQYSPVVDGHELKVLNSGVNVPVVCDGVIINIVKGYQNLRTLFGKPILPLTYGNQLQPTFAGVEMYMSTGTRNLAQYNGISIDSLYPDSNTSYNFDLLVTPTHIYKNQFAHVAAKYRFPQGLIGKYQLKVKDEVVIPWGASTDISTVDFNIMQSMLEYGKNPCRLEYLYPDGQFKFLDFEVTREEPQRTRVERTFKAYDGGYDGDRMLSASGYYPFSPCFLVPEDRQATVIKTTDFTKIPLQKYTGVQGVSVEAEGALLLATFDEGYTWKSLIGDSWQDVALDNIDSIGMPIELVNSTIFARWLEIFQPKSLDFAVYLDNSLSKLVDINRISIIATGVSTYTPPSDMGITRVHVQSANYAVRVYRALINEVWREVFRTSSPTDGSVGNSVSYPEYGDRPTSIETNNSTTVYAAPKVAYLKSINVDITPRLKTGYAFIM